MKRIVVPLLALNLVSCDSERAEPKGDPKTNESLESVSEDARDWPLARGGAGLSGKVDATLPLNPEIKWTFETTGPIIGEAVVSQGVVVFGDSAGFLTALNLADGEQIWQKEFEESFEAAPGILEDTVYVGSGDTFLYALDLKTGEQKWSVETEDKITAGVNLTVNPEGEEWWVLLNGYDGVCRALRASDGSEVWQRQTEDAINGSPAVVDGKFVVFGGCDSSLYTLDLGSGEIVKKIPGETPIVSTVGTDGTFVSWPNHENRVLGADLESGEVRWNYRDKSRSFPFRSSPAVDAERVYIGGHDKRIHAINRETGELEWKFKTGGRIESSPILFKDGLVCGSSDGRLYALDLEEGEELWQIDLGESIVAPASFASGLILVGGESGTLFALEGN